MTKEEAINKLKEDKWCFKEMYEFHDDIDVAKVALKNGHNLSHLSSKLKDNKELVLLAVSNAGVALQYASIRLQSDKDVIAIAIENRPEAACHVGVDIDREYYLKRIKEYPSLIKDAPYVIQDDREIVLIAIKCYSKLLQYISSQLQDDAEIVKIAVKNDGKQLQYASKRLQDNDEIVKLAIEQNIDNYRYASARLQQESGTINITITKRIVQEIVTEYEHKVEIPRNIYFSDSFDPEEYFDESEAVCTMEDDIESEDEEFNYYE